LDIIIVADELVLADDYEHHKTFASGYLTANQFWFPGLSKIEKDGTGRRHPFTKTKLTNLTKPKLMKKM
jgi:hypothetical protein